MSRANLPAAPTQWQPVQSTTGVTYMTGLTIREHFAAMAMQGICAAVTDYCGGRVIMCAEIASDAVYAADALIAELAKVQP